MPPAACRRHANRKPSSQHPTIEPYPSPSQSRVPPIPQEEPSSFSIFQDPITSSATTYHPNLNTTVLGLAIEPPSPLSSGLSPDRRMSISRQTLHEEQQPKAPSSRKPWQSKDRPGGNSKSILLHPRPFGKPRKEVHRTYTWEFKLQVLSFWLHHKIPIGPTTFRGPAKKEVAIRYLVPEGTIGAWHKPDTMSKIVNWTKSTRRVDGVRGCQWPEMEGELYQAYRKRREERKSVRRS